MNLENLFSSVLPADQIVHPKNFEYASTTGYQPKVAGVVKPKTQQQVQDIVKIATKHDVPLYPISSGKNWGYSDGLPVGQDNLIVDLSLMDAVIEYNPELGYVTVEPGVSQRALAEFLYANGDQYIISPTGSSPEATIIGNYLERGFGVAPHMDHAAAVTHIKAVLADGELYEPVLTQLGCQQIDKLYRHGLGAYTDGLFFQSGLGIVTQMTIKLSLRSETSLVVVAEAEKTGVFQAVDRLRALRQRWDTPSLSMKIFSASYALAASGVPYPDDLRAERKAIDDQRLDTLARENDISPYSLVITVTGPKALTRGIAKDAATTLKPVTTQYISVNERRFKWISRLKPFLPQTMQRKIVPLNALWGFMHGQPSDSILSFAYWRSEIRDSLTKPLNPAQDGCGLIWFAPIIPMNRHSVKMLEDVMQDVCPKYGITPAYNFTNYSDGYFVVLAALIYERNGGKANAQQCYLELMERCIKKGFAPYRVPSFALKKLYRDVEPFNNKIRHALDSKDIISPMRYS